MGTARMSSNENNSGDCRKLFHTELAFTNSRFYNILGPPPPLFHAARGKREIDWSLTTYAKEFRGPEGKSAERNFLKNVQESAHFRGKKRQKVLVFLRKWICKPHCKNARSDSHDLSRFCAKSQGNEGNSFPRPYGLG